MKKIKLFGIFIGLLSLLTFYFLRSRPQQTQTITTAKGEIGNFALLDHTGVFHELYRDSDAAAIVIISQGNDCPIVQKYSAIINQLKKKFEPKNIVFYLLNSNQQDTREAIIKEAKTYGFEIPILMDPSQLVAESLGITRTSEAVVINPHGWKMIYRGAISDRIEYGADKQKSQNNYLNDVLESFIQNKTITTEAAPAKGCLITFSSPNISYEKNIGPLLAEKCLACHSEDRKILPNFSDYNKVKSWSAMTRETLLTKRMPPSGVDTFYGNFKAPYDLSAQERRDLVKWIDAGTPRDGKTDPLTEFKAEKNKKPIEIYSAGMSKDKVIPPGGEIEYQYLQLDGVVPYDLWVKGLYVTTTNPRQLHHVSLLATPKPLQFYIDYRKKHHPMDEVALKSNKVGDIPLYTKSAIYEYESLTNTEIPRFQIWGLGKKQPFFLGPKVYSFIPKGSYLILESHYMGTGKEETEKTSIKFYGSLKKPLGQKQLHTKTIANRAFKIPPMVKDFTVETDTWQPKKKIHVLSFLTHLHMRGKSARLETLNQGGEEKTILSIPNYYYGWQTGSSLPLSVPITFDDHAVTFKGVCHYDNSPQNPYNPDPTKEVAFGQRVDSTEMCHFHIHFTFDDE